MMEKMGEVEDRLDYFVDCIGGSICRPHGLGWSKIQYICQRQPKSGADPAGRPVGWAERRFCPASRAGCGRNCAGPNPIDLDRLPEAAGGVGGPLAATCVFNITEAKSNLIGVR